ncbi:MAG: D-aminoacyl-tRNA deacylase, partial [Betaproteobacteria bacterium]
MKALVQRVSAAHVVVDGETVGRIDDGLLVLLCALHGDSPAHADQLLAKLLKLRIFSDLITTHSWSAVKLDLY